MTYHIITYGCQMNKSDSERIATLLEKRGYKKASQASEADLVVINVCSVRQKPVDKVKSQISRLRSSHSARSSGGQTKIILTGCILDADKKDFEKLGSEIKSFKEIKDTPPTTAFVPITRGCNNFCTYCAVPYTRGAEHHRPVKKILAEVRQLIKGGHEEIMLLGQNVNSYPNFVGLLRKVTALPGGFKIKFITNHPKDFNDELIGEMAHNPKIVKYVHLPFQAGDNAVLKKMNRKYTRQQYLALARKIKKAMPEVEITTDIIVGFPGETKKQFGKTVEVMKKVGFKQAYVAKYSPRPGTAAALLKDNVPPEEKKRREQTLRKLINKNGSRWTDRPKLNQKIVVILGQTASGKTGLAVKLAKKFNGEIISADSRQIYKEMNIGTAKTTQKEMQGIPHHLLSIASPNKKFSVAEYQKLAIEKINHIIKKGKTPFLVGGSPFYIYSAVEGWEFPKMKTDQRLRKQLEQKSLAELNFLLKHLDPERASSIETKNKRRLIRAIEIAKALGRVPELKKNQQFDYLLIGIEITEEKLKQRISKRVDEMVKQGLEKEVKKLAKKYGFRPQSMQTIGYAEWLRYRKELSSFRGRSLAPSFQKIGEEIKVNTWRFAKRQMTWFKRDKKIHWIENQRQAEKLIKRFLK